MDALEEVAYNKLVKHRKACVSNSLFGTAFYRALNRTKLTRFWRKL